MYKIFLLLSLLLVNIGFSEIRTINLSNAIDLALQNNLTLQQLNRIIKSPKRNITKVLAIW